MRNVVITDSCDHMDAVGSTPVLRYMGLPKRIFDVFLALLILPVVAPALALPWLPTSLDGGPALIEEEQVGKDGRRFTCWKLRTIALDSKKFVAYLCTSDPTVNKDWQVNQKIAKDLRTTGFGRFLRKFGLDELPLLFTSSVAT